MYFVACSVSVDTSWSTYINDTGFKSWRYNNVMNKYYTKEAATTFYVDDPPIPPVKHFNSLSLSLGSLVGRLPCPVLPNKASSKEPSSKSMAQTMSLKIAFSMLCWILVWRWLKTYPPMQCSCAHFCFNPSDFLSSKETHWSPPNVTIWAADGSSSVIFPPLAMARLISPADKTPPTLVQSPGLPGPEKGQPGAVQLGSFKVKPVNSQSVSKKSIH